MFDDTDQPSFATTAVEAAAKLPHIMDYTDIRVLEAMFALIRRGISNVIEYNNQHPDFPLEVGQINNYMQKWVVFACIWGVGGSMNL
jgi:dynein heavy chain 1, cytosolic